MQKKVDRKRFVRYKEGAELYSMCQSKFEDMAKEAGAIYKLNKLVLVNCDVFEEYLETFRIKEQSGRICTYFLKLGVDLLTGNK